MTFSEFAQMLYPIIGNGDNIPDYIPNLIRHIMLSPTTEQEKKLDAENNYYPLLTNEFSLLTKIYNGKRELSRKVAGQITSHLSKEKFHSYLKSFPQDVIDKIGDTLQKKGYEMKDNDIANYCTDLFASILYDCASAKRSRRNNSLLKELSRSYYALPFSELERANLNYKIRLLKTNKNKKGSPTDNSL